MSDRSSSTLTKGLKVASNSPRLPKGFKTQSLPREDLTPPIKGRIKQQISTAPKTVEPVIASGANRDPGTDVIYLKQMLQASINRLQEMESDKHERYERWKQGLTGPIFIKIICTVFRMHDAVVHRGCKTRHGNGGEGARAQPGPS
jgi:hypothetical protein